MYWMLVLDLYFALCRIPEHSGRLSLWVLLTITLSCVALSLLPVTSVGFPKSNVFAFYLLAFLLTENFLFFLMHFSTSYIGFTFLLTDLLMCLFGLWEMFGFYSVLVGIANCCLSVSLSYLVPYSDRVYGWLVLRVNHYDGMSEVYV